MNQPVNPLAELGELKQLQQSCGSAANTRALTSFLKWPHESGHYAVGGADFSSARHHLTPVAVYLGWSLPDSNWCRRLFALPLSGSWSSSLFRCLCLASWLSRFLHAPLEHVSLPDILHLTLNMIICSGLCVSSYYTLSFSVSFTVSLSVFVSVSLVPPRLFSPSCCVSLYLSTSTFTWTMHQVTVGRGQSLFWVFVTLSLKSSLFTTPCSLLFHWCT